MTKIKICGLTRRGEIKAVNRWRPDYVGFVFCESRRQVTRLQASMLKADLDSRIKATGVFVNEPILSIIELCHNGVIDVVQLHGDESQAYISELKTHIDCPVIKAVRVQSADQIRGAERLPCDWLLLDTYQNGRYGGTGKGFDYGMIPSLRKQFFLAGGLDYSNVELAIQQCNPYGVDISSGVETDGVKDEDKIRQIIQSVRSMEDKKEATESDICAETRGEAR